MKFIISFLAIFSIFISINAEVFEGRDLRDIKWEKVDEEDSIEVFRESNPQGELIAVRGKMIINAPLKTILSILVDTDYESQREWVPNLVEFTTISSNTIFDRILYVHVDIPWPVRDRDFTYIAKILPVDSTSVMLDYRSIEEVVKEKRHVVRGAMKTLFILNKISENSTSVDLRALADPAGAVPKWIVNFAQRNYSYDMLKRVSEQVTKKKDSIVVLSEFENLLN